MNPRHTYLHDHLAGADFAVDLLEELANQHEDALTGSLAAVMLVEIREDREWLRKLAKHTHAGSNLIKGFGALLAEKALVLKTATELDSDFSRFERLEFLVVGALGKMHLWRALQVGAPEAAAEAGLDLTELVARAERQYLKLEERRLQLAASALRAA